MQGIVAKFLLIAVAITSCAVLVLSGHVGWPLPWTYLLGINVSTAVLYLYDKRAAIASRLRVPEVTLHIATLLGGTPMAIVCQQVLRHKTVKTHFRVWFYLIVAVQLAALAYVLPWRAYLAELLP